MTSQKRFLAAAIAVFLIAFIAAYAFAGTVNVSGTISNSAPTISSVFIVNETDGTCDGGDYPASGTSIAAFTPGTDALCVTVTVSDPNGNDTISLSLSDTNILIWSDSNSATEAQANSAHGWDRHKITTFEDCTTAAAKSTMSAGDTKFCGELPPDSDSTSDSGISVKDINGAGWDVKANISDVNYGRANSSLANSVTVETTTGISLDQSSCTFTASPDANVAMDCSGSPQEKITITHTGNVEEKVYAYMSTTFSTPDVIDGRHVYWKAAQIGTPSTTDINANSTSITNTNCVSQILSNWGRGTQSTSATAAQSTYWYMAVPAVSPGDYSGGVITLTAYAQGTACS
ncbi:MAG: hypothetical protein HY394_02815 [Candidatus Diapherotrites archaeon]|nr:hypothetical protein [Candidatus Diapherotrites archaeon]